MAKNMIRRFAANILEYGTGNASLIGVYPKAPGKTYEHIFPMMRAESEKSRDVIAEMADFFKSF